MQFRKMIATAVALVFVAPAIASAAPGKGSFMSCLKAKSVVVCVYEAAARFKRGHKSF
jgi:hypothetical protein